MLSADLINVARSGDCVFKLLPSAIPICNINCHRLCRRTLNFKELFIGTFVPSQFLDMCT